MVAPLEPLRLTYRFHMSFLTQNVREEHVMDKIRPSNQVPVASSRWPFPEMIDPPCANIYLF